MMRSMFAGVSGLRNHQIKMDVLGNNIANVNTTGFKAGRVTFQDMLSQTLSGGTAPQPDGAGGINPAQIGLGMIVGAIDTLHSQGNLGTTGKSTDMAIQGNGFFIVNDSQAPRYTRDGTFDIGQDASLVNPASGYRVQGWMAVDGDIDTSGVLENIYIPIGRELVARATDTVNLVGNLNAGGDAGTTGTVAYSQTLYSGGGLAAGGSLITSLEDSGGTSYGIDAGSTIYINAEKNGVPIETGEFTVTATSDMDDLAAYLTEVFGIVDNSNTNGTTNSVDQSAGVTYDAVNGRFLINGNFGQANAITEIFITAEDSTGATLTDFDSDMALDVTNGFVETTEADGESIMSTMVVYDSLGDPHRLNVAYTKTASNEWVWNADCADDTDSYNVGSGVIFFNTDGSYYTDDSVLSLDLGNGSTTPLTPTLNFASITQFSDDSTVNVSDQDGFSAGTLEKFSIGSDGVITGIYTNGLTSILGQIAIANFSNPGGLTKDGNNLFAQSTNSGEVQIGTAGTGGRGYINNGVLELSNVDLPQTFTDMIITQRGFQANARIITTSDDMLQELVNLKR